MNKALKPCVAEAIATFAFCFIGAASIINNAGLVGIAIAHGCMMAVLISALGHISGGHNNPAVTFGAWVGGKISGQMAGAYVVSQLIGASVAGFLLLQVFPESAWKPVNLGTPGLGQGVTMGTGILVETVLTFFLVLVVYGTGIDEKGTWKTIGGFGIGLTIMCDILMGGPLTGASMNPARTFGPALAAGYWDNHIVYWIGPLAGGALAGLVYGRFLIKH
ncbi:MAG: aquaporin [Nitrospirae bacterium]|nr:aquaporin [Nitrospirota bacterium]